CTGGSAVAVLADPITSPGEGICADTEPTPSAKIRVEKSKREGRRGWTFMVGLHWSSNPKLLEWAGSTWRDGGPGRRAALRHLQTHHGGTETRRLLHPHLFNSLHSGR